MPAVEACCGEVGGLVSGSAFGPDDRDVEVAVACLVDDVGRSAVASRGLAVPDGEQVVRLVKHGLAGGHVRLLVGLDAVETDNLAGLGEQGVIGRVGVGGKAPRGTSRPGR